MEGGSADITLSIYPNPPHNVSLLNTDTTVTILIQNKGTQSQEVTFEIDKKSENLFVNGRDGVDLPATRTIGPKENFYHSLALLPSNPWENNYRLTIEVTGPQGNVLASEEFILRVLRPELDDDNLENIITNYGLKKSSPTFLIPCYRRYWHLKRDEVGRSDPGYVWLVGDESRNIIIDDETGRILEENVILPWEINSSAHGRSKVWVGADFEGVMIPTVRVEGDSSYNRERFELYYAGRENNPAWVSRRIFYWAPEETVRGSVNEIPDTERVELWVSAENGSHLFTVSDYHYHAFRYDAVESYTIQTYYHCPLPEGAPLQWSNFMLVDYKNVYPQAQVSYDHMGFSGKVHPLGEALERKMPLIKRNLVGAILACLVFVVPYLWGRWKE